MPILYKKNAEKEMQETNKTYEEILEGYKALKSSIDSKKNTLEEKISKLKDKIAENNTAINEKFEAGAIEETVELTEENRKNEQVLSQYVKMLESVSGPRKNNISKESNDLYEKAVKEINKLQREYDKKFTELLNPLIELSKETKLQMDLLYMARKHVGMLENRNDQFVNECRMISFDCMRDVYYMQRLDRLIQSTEYKKNMNISDSDLGYHPAKGQFYAWHKAEDEKVKKELLRWQ